MAEILSGSIDLSKIDKTKIVEVTLKDGTTAKFLNIQISVNNEADTYGNIAGLTIQQTQEERTAKTKRIYLGNLKRVWSDAPAPTLETSKKEDLSDSLPF
jgi:formate-dependent nitrite reductase cytochrome c552 subunit